MLARKLARPSIKETLGLKITLQPKIYISEVIQSACRGFIDRLRETLLSLPAING